MLRRALRRIYTVCGYAAAAFLVAIAAVTLLQVVARQAGVAIETIEVAGFCLAASTFLGLAHTFVNGAHVRVSLVSQSVPPAVRRWIELWCCAVGFAVVAYAAWNMALYTLESWQFGDISPGLAAVPFWIPQLGVAVGMIVMAIGILEQATLVWIGEEPDYAQSSDAAME
ncbi:TRAP transporter small permease [Pikeienuella sp. HZG-20]|uniref:TRAP transporter small permease n=1 Tax=Paludibacillus litoralis TaxID=3133267 RepID=UPI0030EB3A00